MSNTRAGVVGLWCGVLAVAAVSILIGCEGKTKFVRVTAPPDTVSSPCPPCPPCDDED